MEDAGHLLGERGRQLVHAALDQLVDAKLAIRLKGRRAGKHLHYQDAEGPPIDRYTVALAGDDFGREVLGRSAERVRAIGDHLGEAREARREPSSAKRPRRSDPRSAEAARRGWRQPEATRGERFYLGKAEIDEFQVAVGAEHQVLWLQVAVRDLASVEVGERGGDHRGVEAPRQIVKLADRPEPREELTTLRQLGRRVAYRYVPVHTVTQRYTLLHTATRCDITG